MDSIISIVSTNSGSVVLMKKSKKAVTFMIDFSGSMGDDGKIDTAKMVLRKCIAALPQDCYFCVIGFNDEAEVIIPMTLATSKAKESADAVVKRISAGGGTEMSKALSAAMEEFSKVENTISYAFFVTDGQNNDQDRERLKRTLSRCEGKFQCDCYGIGTDWEPKQLREISRVLLGTADAAADPLKLEQKFKETLERAMSKGISDVRLRLQMPKTSKAAVIKQMSPEIVDLSKLAKQVDEKNIDIPLGAWGTDETREYHVVFELQPQGEGEQMMACRPKIVYSIDGSEVVTDGDRIVAAWSDDASLTSRIDSRVAEYTGQQEMAQCIEEGLKAKARGDITETTRLLGKAAKIAVESGNEEVTSRLKKVVDIVDAETGTVRLRTGGNKAADLELEMGGTRTVRKAKQQGGN